MYLMAIWATLNVCLLSVNKFYSILFNNNFLTGYRVVSSLKYMAPFTKLILKICHVRLTQ